MKKLLILILVSVVSIFSLDAMNDKKRVRSASEETEPVKKRVKHGDDESSGKSLTVPTVGVNEQLTVGSLLSTTAIASSSSSSSSSSNAYPGVVKLSDDLYVGKVSDDFYLAMERIDRNNIDSWLRYAHAQDDAICHQPIEKYLPNISGAGHFELVLKCWDEGRITNQLWVAYASCKPIVGKATFDFSFEHSIEMYVSVVTSPDSDVLITSNMGISRTWETAYALARGMRKQHPKQSVHLFSFAAKVMKILYPEKVYMLTAPVPAMCNILRDNMPKGAVFVGDNKYMKRLEAAQKDPKERCQLCCFEIRHKANESDEQYQKKVDLLFAKKLSELKTCPPRLITDWQGWSIQRFTIQKPSGEKLVEFDRSSKAYQWMFTEPYRPLCCLYVLVDLTALAAWGTLVN